MENCPRGERNSKSTPKKNVVMKRKKIKTARQSRDRETRVQYIPKCAAKSQQLPNRCVIDVPILRLRGQAVLGKGPRHSPPILPTTYGEIFLTGINPLPPGGLNEMQTFLSFKKAPRESRRKWVGIYKKKKCRQVTVDCRIAALLVFQGSPLFFS